MIVSFLNTDYQLNNLVKCNHLQNVLATVSDRRTPISSGGTHIDYYEADVTNATLYYPFGMEMKTYQADSNGYRYGFSGMESDNEVVGDGNSIDFGARIYDSRLGRWYAVDELANMYSPFSPYGYALNTPISAIDPDGKAVVFIGGLRLWYAAADQPRSQSTKEGAYSGIYKTDVFNYWSTAAGETNSFGKSVNMVAGFTSRLGDENTYFTSGSAEWRSQATTRHADGVARAKQFHEKVKKGEITIADGETIKIIAHSQGGAHASGFAKQLMEYKNDAGEALYNVEVVYYITPHQPTDIQHPKGIRGVQYSHPGDMISSHNYTPNGGSKFGKIMGITEFDGREIIGGKGMPESTGLNGNRCGHNVCENQFIFDIAIEDDGYVGPRKTAETSTNGATTSSDGTASSSTATQWYHTIQAGETLTSIAGMYKPLGGVTINSIQSLNSDVITDVNVIKAGAKIRIK